MARYVLAWAFLPTLINAFSASGSDNVVLYWGQNSAGTQKTLGEYCRTDAADMYVVSFLNNFGMGQQMSMNLASCWDTYPNSKMLKCPAIGEDIKLCQHLGKKVIVSLGGAIGEYGLNSVSDAENVANDLWAMFGGGSSSTRPFGDAVVDGFDLDLENRKPEHYDALVKSLRNHFAKDAAKKYFISAAPQCVFPDASVGMALDLADIDFAFVQFYNNPPCAAAGSGFNWKTWKDFARSKAANPNLKVYVGLPASTRAASSGYISPEKLSQIVAPLKADPVFGGLMAWDASQAFSNVVDGKSYADWMKAAVSGAESPNPQPSSSEGPSSESKKPYSTRSSTSPNANLESASLFSSLASSPNIPILPSTMQASQSKSPSQGAPYPEGSISSGLEPKSSSTKSSINLNSARTSNSEITSQPKLEQSSLNPGPPLQTPSSRPSPAQASTSKSSPVPQASLHASVPDFNSIQSSQYSRRPAKSFSTGALEPVTHSDSGAEQASLPLPALSPSAWAPNPQNPFLTRSKSASTFSKSPIQTPSAWAPNPKNSFLARSKSASHFMNTSISSLPTRIPETENQIDSDSKHGSQSKNNIGQSPSSPDLDSENHAQPQEKNSWLENADSSPVPGDSSMPREHKDSHKSQLERNPDLERAPKTLDDSKLKTGVPASPTHPPSCGPSDAFETKIVTRTVTETNYLVRTITVLGQTRMETQNAALHSKDVGSTVAAGAKVPHTTTITIDVGAASLVCPKLNNAQNLPQNAPCTKYVTKAAPESQSEKSSEEQHRRKDHHSADGQPEVAQNRLASDPGSRSDTKAGTESQSKSYEERERKGDFTSAEEKPGKAQDENDHKSNFNSGAQAVIDSSSDKSNEDKQRKESSNLAFQKAELGHGKPALETSFGPDAKQGNLVATKALIPQIQTVTHVVTDPVNSMTSTIIRTITRMITVQPGPTETRKSGEISGNRESWASLAGIYRNATISTNFTAAQITRGLSAQELPRNSTRPMLESGKSRRCSRRKSKVYVSHSV